MIAGSRTPWRLASTTKPDRRLCPPKLPSNPANRARRCTISPTAAVPRSVVFLGAAGAAITALPVSMRWPIDPNRSSSFWSAPGRTPANIDFTIYCSQTHSSFATGTTRTSPRCGSAPVCRPRSSRCRPPAPWSKRVNPRLCGDELSFSATSRARSTACRPLAPRTAPVRQFLRPAAPWADTGFRRSPIPQLRLPLSPCGNGVADA